ncbi:MAG: ORF6N domain-containing protein, partial [Mariniphaga sp.]
GLKVMLDYDLAELYEVQTRVLNQAVKRNIKRFPNDFMFQLNKNEWGILISQIVTSKTERRGGTQKLPYAFTEQGVSMLSGILNSDKAIDVNISIMRAFVFIRQYALTHKDLTAKLHELESKYDTQFKDVYDAISYLLDKDKTDTNQKQRKRIGYKPD